MKLSQLLLPLGLSLALSCALTQAAPHSDKPNKFNHKANISKKVVKHDSRHSPRAEYIQHRNVRTAHYHPVGYRLPVLPTGHYRLHHLPHALYYHGGIFYGPAANGFVVVSAPLGIRVRHLPAGFISLAIGSASYYYINDTYYRQEGEEYVVVQAPTEAQTAQETPAASGLVIYPKNNQTDEQLDKDRYQCHLWASKQTGFDPSVSNQVLSERSNYNRAMSACLEGRGYVVK